MRTVYDVSDVRRTVETMIDRIATAFAASSPLNIIGIRTRGEILAERLAQGLGSRGFSQIGRGVLDITLYRDDLSEIGPNPVVRPDGDRHRHRRGSAAAGGRRAVHGAVGSGGVGCAERFRPAAAWSGWRCSSIGAGRELPIQADFVGLTFGDMPADHRVNVRLSEFDGRDEILVEPKGGASDRWPTPSTLDSVALDAKASAYVRGGCRRRSWSFVGHRASRSGEVFDAQRKKGAALRGRVVVNAFFEDSTRTRHELRRWPRRDSVPT